MRAPDKRPLKFGLSRLEQIHPLRIVLKVFLWGGATGIFLLAVPTFLAGHPDSFWWVLGSAPKVALMVFSALSFVPGALIGYGGVSERRGWAVFIPVALVPWVLVLWVQPVVEYVHAERAHDSTYVAQRFPFGARTPLSERALWEYVEANPPADDGTDKQGYSKSVENPLINPPNWTEGTFYSQTSILLFSILLGMLGWAGGAKLREHQVGNPGWYLFLLWFFDLALFWGFMQTWTASLFVSLGTAAMWPAFGVLIPPAAVLGLAIRLARAARDESEHVRSVGAALVSGRPWSVRAKIDSPDHDEIKQGDVVFFDELGVNPRIQPPARFTTISPPDVVEHPEVFEVLLEEDGQGAAAPPPPRPKPLAVLE